MMKRVLFAALLTSSVLLPATASAKDPILVCRGGKFRMVISSKDKGPVVGAKFKKYSKKGTPFVKKAGKHPYNTLSPGQCAILDGALAVKAETHFVYEFKSPVDICAGILFPSYKLKDVHWHLGTKAQTKYQDKAFLLGLTNKDLIFKMRVSVAGKGTKKAFFVVKEQLGVYKRTAPNKMLYGAAFNAYVAKSTNSLSCLQVAARDYFKVK